MDDQTKELVAMSAAAANCHPCMDHHLAQCDKLGIDREEVAEAVKVGLMVNHGAESAIGKKARELFGESVLGHHRPVAPKSGQSAAVSYDHPSLAVFHPPQAVGIGRRRRTVPATWVAEVW